MKHDIRYIGRGGEVSFSKKPFIYQESNLFDYHHDVITTMNSDFLSSSMDLVSYGSIDKTIVIGVYTDDYRNVIEGLERLFEEDIANDSWGKLCVNGSYIMCNVISSSKLHWNTFKKINEITLELKTKSALWITEKVHNFYGEILGGRDFRYPFSFPFSFSSSGGKVLENASNADTRAEIVIYGPASNPRIVIGGAFYRVFTDLLSGERMVINQITKTVVKITSSGDVVDIFNHRDKENSIFTPIPAGSNPISLNFSSPFSITLFEERSEPAWK